MTARLFIPFLLVALLFAMPPAAQAALPVPGDACTAGQTNWWNLHGQTVNTGYVNGMFCNGSNWVGVINFQSTGKVGIGTTSPAAPLAA